MSTKTPTNAYDDCKDYLPYPDSEDGSFTLQDSSHHRADNTGYDSDSYNDEIPEERNIPQQYTPERPSVTMEAKMNKTKDMEYQKAKVELMRLRMEKDQAKAELSKSELPLQEAELAFRERFSDDCWHSLKNP